MLLKIASVWQCEGEKGELVTWCECLRIGIMFHSLFPKAPSISLSLASHWGGEFSGCCPGPVPLNVSSNPTKTRASEMEYAIKNVNQMAAWSYAWIYQIVSFYSIITWF